MNDTLLIHCSFLLHCCRLQLDGCRGPESAAATAAVAAAAAADDIIII